MILFLTVACTPTVDVDLRTDPVRAGATTWDWPAADDPRSRVKVAAFRGDVPTDRTLTVRVDASTAARRLTLMQEITALDHISLTDEKSTRRIEFLASTDKPADDVTCWLPIVSLPTGQIMVAGSQRPARHVQRAEHHLLATSGCVTTTSEVLAALQEIPYRCDTTAVAVDATTTWSELRPWLDVVPRPRLLVERPEVLSNIAAAVEGRCDGAVRASTLAAP